MTCPTEALKTRENLVGIYSSDTPPIRPSKSRKWIVRNATVNFRSPKSEAKLIAAMLSRKGSSKLGMVRQFCVRKDVCSLVPLYDLGYVVLAPSPTSLL